MIEKYRLFIEELREMNFEITNIQANEAWKAFKGKMNDAFLSKGKELFVKTREWANPPSLFDVLSDLGKGEEIEKSKPLLKVVKIPEGIIVDSTPTCCKEGIVYATFTDEAGNVSQPYAFRCPCPRGNNLGSAFIMWNNQKGFVKE